MLILILIMTLSLYPKDRQRDFDLAMSPPSCYWKSWKMWHLTFLKFIFLIHKQTQIHTHTKKIHPFWPWNPSLLSAFNKHFPYTFQHKPPFRIVTNPRGCYGIKVLIFYKAVLKDQRQTALNSRIANVFHNIFTVSHNHGYIFPVCAIIRLLR